MSRIRLICSASLVIVVLTACETRASSDSTSSTPRWGIATTLGTGSAGGDFSDLLKAPVSGEIELFRYHGLWRYGVGVSFGSFDMKPPYDAEPEWGFQQTYLSAGRVFPLGSRLQPYVTLRAGLARLHPRSLLFEPAGFVVDPEHPGDSPTEAANGFSVGVIPGIEFRLSRLVAIQASAAFTWFDVGEYDLSPVGYPNASSGTTVQWRGGLLWHPDAHGAARAPAGPPYRDAWGVEASYGWAAAEVLGIDFGASAINEYMRNQNFCQISPRSWWHNLKEGFTYDDNKFKTNQLVHPFNGAMYYNASRANGLSFWPSAGYALGGAFVWEAFGETHPISYNDLISTGIGGTAYGEVLYRMASEILDNQAMGRGRTLREVGAFLVDPIRGLNRLLMGHSGRIAPNPADLHDWRPPFASGFLAAGVRWIGEGESITDSTKSYGLFEFDHAYGDPFDGERRGPFDHFDLGAQVNFGDKVGLGRLQIRGDLWSRPLGSSGENVLAIVQDFDYINNNAYEFGGQSFGPTLYSRFHPSQKVQIRTRLDGLINILSAVNSDYAFLATVPDQERYREYDYGPGLGTAFHGGMAVSGRDVLSLYYQLDWIWVKNGSIVYVDGSKGSDASHIVQALGLRGFVPLRGDYGLGADGFVFYRRSRYSANEVIDRDQRNPQARVYLAWNPKR